MQIKINNQNAASKFGCNFQSCRQLQKSFTTLVSGQETSGYNEVDDKQCTSSESKLHSSSSGKRSSSSSEKRHSSTLSKKRYSSTSSKKRLSSSTSEKHRSSSTTEKRHSSSSEKNSSSSFEKHHSSTSGKRQSNEQHHLSSSKRHKSHHSKDRDKTNLSDKSKSAKSGECSKRHNGNGSSSSSRRDKSNAPQIVSNDNTLFKPDAVLNHRSNVATKDSQAADKRAAILKRVAVNQGTDVSLSNILKASGSITWRKPTMGSSKIAPVVPKPIIASKMLNRADVQAETLSSKHLPIIAEGASKLTPTLTVEASLREPETEHNDIPSSVLKMIEMDLSTREPPAPLPLTVQQSQTSVKSILKRPRSSSSRDPSSDEQPLKAPRVSFSFQLPRPFPSLASSAAKPISTVPKISVRRDLFQTNRVSCIKCHS